CPLRRAAGPRAHLDPIPGPGQPPYFPLMWAREAADSHLLTADILRDVILATGFIERYWHPAATFRESAPSPGSAPRTIQSLVMGERLAAIQEARARNAAEDRLRTVLLVCERP